MHNSCWVIMELALLLSFSLASTAQIKMPHIPDIDFPDIDDPEHLLDVARQQTRRMAIEAHRDDQKHAVSPIGGYALARKC